MCVRVPGVCLASVCDRLTGLRDSNPHGLVLTSAGLLGRLCVHTSPVPNPPAPAHVLTSPLRFYLQLCCHRAVNLSRTWMCHVFFPSHGLSHTLDRCLCVVFCAVCSALMSARDLTGTKNRIRWKFFVPFPTVSRLGWKKKRFLLCLQLLSGANEGMALTSLCCHSNPASLLEKAARLFSAVALSEHCRASMLKQCGTGELTSPSFCRSTSPLTTMPGPGGHAIYRVISDVARCL